MGIKIVWKFISEGVNESRINVTCFFFVRFVSLRPYIILWICIRHKKVTRLDTFLSKLCSRKETFNRMSARWLLVSYYSITASILAGRVKVWQVRAVNEFSRFLSRKLKSLTGWSCIKLWDTFGIIINFRNGSNSIKDFFSETKKSLEKE